MSSVDPDQMPQNVTSDQGPHCLPHTGTGSKMDLFKYENGCGKELWCLNT